MRGGYKIFDCDTHFHPSAETLVNYMTADLRERQEEFERSEQQIGWAGEKMTTPYRHLYRFGGVGGWGANPPRHLGESGPRPNADRHFQRFMGATIPSLGGADYAIEDRVLDMDREGQDIHLMVPSSPTGHPDVAVDMGMIQTVHRYLDDICTTHGDRLCSLILTSARDIPSSVSEIQRYASSKWARGVMVNLPIDYPIDHPDLDPLWSAANDAGHCIVHHSFAAGYPGYRDLWDNPFVGRTASHPWAAMRMVAAFLGAGLFDRFPDLRLSILESGFGWLPFWMKRMEDQVLYMGYTADLKHTMTEYMTGGRFFAGIVLHEGEEMVRMVSESMGDHVLMFGSDYPHAESRFPDSVDIVLGWDRITEEMKRKLLWDNAAACFGLP